MILCQTVNQSGSCLIFPNWRANLLRGGGVNKFLFNNIDDTGIHATKTYLQQHLSIRYLGSPRYSALSLRIRTGS